MTRSFAAACVGALVALASGPALSQAKPAAKPAAKSAKAAHHKPAAKKAEPAKAEEALEATDEQRELAKTVITGRADCEFKQSVNVKAAEGKPGVFDVAYGKTTYHMVAQPTTTGAVRLHDPKADVVWLQIPVKSMLMNQRAGQRLVDACQLPEQRAAAEAIEQARVAAKATAAAASAADQAAAAAAHPQPGGTAPTATAAADAAAAAQAAAEAAAAAAQAASAAAAAATPPAQAAAPAAAARSN